MKAQKKGKPADKPSEKKDGKSGYDELADYIINHPCHWCGANIAKGEKYSRKCMVVQ